MDARGELVSTVAFALRFKVLRARWDSDADVRLAAEAVVAYLEQCRYVIRHDPAPFPGPGYYPDVPKG